MIDERDLFVPKNTEKLERTPTADLPHATYVLRVFLKWTRFKVQFFDTCAGWLVRIIWAENEDIISSWLSDKAETYIINEEEVQEKGAEDWVWHHDFIYQSYTGKDEQGGAN